MITHDVWLADEIAGLPCRVLLPQPYEPQVRRYPLVVSLHGSGERGSDNWAQLANGLSVFEQRRAAHPCIVVAPQLPLGETWGGSWYGGETAGQRMLVAVVRALRERSSVDPRRVYGVGFSMGAIGLWDILVRHTGLFTAAVLVAGDLDLASASSLTSFPLWAVVGGRDELVPPDNTRAFARLTEERGGLAKVTEIASAGHDVWRSAFAHGPLWDWLFTHEAPPP
ncbi:MAG: prolyl oligopeptidase family serine peptidase [Kofleriaceae bacterium]|nr:prolyl oligopeptidase family serine peptidase [Kofleriaceae bacterium]